MSPIDGIHLDDALPEAERIGPPCAAVTGCAIDVDQISPGDAYIELSRESIDHETMATAVDRGARAVVCRRAIEPSEISQFAVGDIRVAYGRICQALAGDPSRRLKVVAIIGSAGKTTSACLLASVLESGGGRCALWSSFGAFDGDQLAGPQPTEPAVLAHWLARSWASGCSHAVLELSDTALEQRAAAGVSFDVATVTSLRHDMHRRDVSANRQREIWCSALDQLALDGIAVLNADDPACCRLLSEMHGPTICYGLEQPAEISGQIVERHISEQTFLVSRGNETAPVRTTLVGDHNASHALMAAAVGSAYGIELPVIVRGLESVRRVPGRLERVECGQPFGVFVDEAGSPERLWTSLATLRRLSTGRVICVCGVTIDDPVSRQEALGHVLEANSDLAVLSAPVDGSHLDVTAADQVLRGFRRRLSPRVMRDRAAAVRWALAEARTGDVVLLAGRSSMSPGLLEDEWSPLSDRETARRWLYDHGATKAPDRRAAA